MFIRDSVLNRKDMHHIEPVGCTRIQKENYKGSPGSGHLVLTYVHPAIYCRAYDASGTRRIDGDLPMQIPAYVLLQ